jgi:hypothetical protein
LTETDLLVAVLHLAKLRQCYVHHCRPARMANGTWRTPISGDAGFPDLVIVTPSAVLWRELKSVQGQLAPEQRLWHQRLTQAGQDVAVWRPQHLESGRIDAELRGAR